MPPAPPPQQEADALLREHIVGATVLGFDTEWRPVGRGYGGDGRCGLIQLATPRAVLLLPIIHLPRGGPPALQQILQDKGTFLVGVGVAQVGHQILLDKGTFLSGRGGVGRHR